MATLPGCEEPTDPSLEPPEIVESPTTAVSASAAATTAPTANTGGAPRTPAEYRKAAEAGDVPSMLLLGRSHESLGQTADARKWYQRAADAGNEDGKKALAQLDAVASTHPSSPTTLPTNVAAASAPANSPSTRRVAIEVPPAADPTKLRWIDIGAVLNYEDIIADGRMVNVDPRSAASPGQKQVFIGRCSARDGSIVVAAMGPSESDLNEVTAVIRVKNRVDPGTSPRVAQAGAVAARVTADNVNPREFLEWITQYLQTEHRSEPIFRNGWRITVSGSAAEGRPDPKPQLGTAVMIEMKK
jgi:TPR repeat protein